MQEETRKKLKKILDSTKIGVSKDFSVEEKQELYADFARYGMFQHTTRNRFFRDGFRAWEVNGIIHCIVDYAAEHPEVAGIAAEIEQFKPDADADTERILELVSDFYSQVESKMCFCDYMNTLGMSHSTTASHFNNPSNFIPWELYGIRAIV